MASERNRILELIEYLKAHKIEVNIAKNKARGNRGFFKAKGDTYRIDIAKGLMDETVLSVLVHEVAHFIHYKYDNTLKSLDFVLDNFSDSLEEELIALTVNSIPKESIKPLFDARENIKAQKLPVYLKKKALNNINNKISRLNRYYNSPTELFARSIEAYMLNRDKCIKTAPLLFDKYDCVISEKRIPMLTELAKILLYNS